MPSPTPTDPEYFRVTVHVVSHADGRRQVVEIPRTTMPAWFADWDDLEPGFIGRRVCVAPNPRLRSLEMRVQPHSFDESGKLYTITELPAFPGF